MGGPLESDLGEPAVGLGLLDLGDERRLDGLGAGAVGAQAISVGRQLVQARPQRLGVGRDPPQLALAALDGIAERPQFTAHLGGGGGSTRAGIVGGRERFREARSLLGEGLFLVRELLGFGRHAGERRIDLLELDPQAGAIRFEVGDDAGVEQLPVVALE